MSLVYRGAELHSPDHGRGRVVSADDWGARVTWEDGETTLLSRAELDALGLQLGRRRPGPSPEERAARRACEAERRARDKDRKRARTLLARLGRLGERMLALDAERLNRMRSRLAYLEVQIEAELARQEADAHGA